MSVLLSSPPDENDDECSVNRVSARWIDQAAQICGSAWTKHDAISLDGGASWWEFYLEDKEFAIGGPVTHTQPAREEWNPIHAGLSYSVIEVQPETDKSLLVVSFGYPESRSFVFRARTRPIQLVLIDADGEMRDAGAGNGETLDLIEFVGRVEVVLPDWRDQPQRIVR